MGAIEENMRIGLNIKRLREKKSLSQDDLATYLGVKRAMVSYYETGERPIPTPIIEKCSQLFGIDEIDLYEENAEQQIANVAFA